MTHAIHNRPDDDLLPLFNRAVAAGRVCLFCGGPLSLPCVVHHFAHGAPIFMHPACAAEFATFLSADVKEILCAENAHLGIQAAARVAEPIHPEAR